MLSNIIIPKNKREKFSDSFSFHIHKFSNRPKPTDKRRILIISCLSEFGCETIGRLFCLPRILSERPGDYKIVVGWYGREYFYRGLVDEFWELKEEHQWLRDYCRAFHHDSKNLKRLEEKELPKQGKVIPSKYLGMLVVGNRCENCNNFWSDIKYVHECPKCKSQELIRSIFGDLHNYRKNPSLLPMPSIDKMEEARALLKPNSVGIFARARKTYGRNLPPEFYIKLINSLKDKGYNPIWLGEKQNTLECPTNDIIDFSRLEKSRDLELTCAIIKQLKFTIQYWTASTRLSAFMGTPYIIFESPNQIWGNGQEGYRLGLIKDLAPIKMIINHYMSAFKDQEKTLSLTLKAIQELEEKNYDLILGEKHFNGKISWK